MDETIAVLIPIKSFNEAKERLSETLNKSERSLLMKKMAENVINSSATLPIWVVCDDDEVALWAESKNVSVIRTKETVMFLIESVSKASLSGVRGILDVRGRKVCTE